MPTPRLPLRCALAFGAAQPLTPVVAVADREQAPTLPAPNQKEHVVHAHALERADILARPAVTWERCLVSCSPLADARAWEVETQALFFFFARSPAL